MSVRTETITLDVCRRGRPSGNQIVVAEGDKGAQFTFSITSNGSPLLLSEYRAQLRATVNDCLVQANLQIVGTNAIYTLDSDLTGAAGTWQPYVALIIGNDVVMSTETFELKVEKGADITATEAKRINRSFEQMLNMWDMAMWGHDIEYRENEEIRENTFNSFLNSAQDGVNTTLESFKTIESVTNEYQISDTETVPTGNWSASVPTTKPGQWLWTRTTTTYNQGEPSVTYSKAYQGKDGLIVTQANLILNSDHPVSNNVYQICQYNLTTDFELNVDYTCTIWGELGSDRTAFTVYIGTSNAGFSLKKIADGVYSATVKKTSWYNDAQAQNPRRLYVYAAPDGGTSTSTITRIKLEKGVVANPTWMSAVTRGTGIVKVTENPGSYVYDSLVKGFQAKYRVPINTLISSSNVEYILIGDVVESGSSHYPVGYVDTSYVYLGDATSIKGDTGDMGSITFPLSIENGGTNAKASKEARNNLFGDTPANNSGTSDADHFLMHFADTANRVQYRTGTNVWDWVKSKIDASINDETTAPNLILGTRDFKEYTKNFSLSTSIPDDGFKNLRTSSTVEKTEDRDGFTVLSVKDDTTTGLFYSSPVKNIEEGEQYTISFEYKLADTTTVGAGYDLVRAITSNISTAKTAGSFRISSYNGIDGDKWYKAVFSVTVSDLVENSFLYLQIYTPKGLKVSYRKFAINRGLVNHPVWSASPFDVQQALTDSTSNGWNVNWISDKTAICTYTRTYNPTGTTDWGGLKYTTPYASAVEWPEPFKSSARELLSANVTIYSDNSSGAYPVISNSGNSWDKFPEVYLITSATWVPSNVALKYMAILQLA